MSAERRFVPTSETLTSHLAGEAILLHMGTKHYFRLNAEGAAVWKLLESGATTPDIITALTAQYDISAEEASAAVNALLAELRDNKLVQTAE
jgi:hypothetical protein